MPAHFLYWWLVVIGSVDLALVSPAIRHAERDNELGRLLSTLCVLAGIVLASGGRITELIITLPGTTGPGVLLIDLGLLGYALFLPKRGLIHLIRRHRLRR